MLETLISIVILGLIAVGSFYSYSFVYQRIFSQRQQRFALGVLQGWMEYTISFLLDPNDPLDTNDISRSLNEKEQILVDRFNEEVSDLNTNIGSNIAFIDPNILRPIYDDKGDYDDIVEIRLRISLSNNEDVKLAGRDLPISLYTNIYTGTKGYTENNR